MKIEDMVKGERVARRTRSRATSDLKLRKRRVLAATASGSRMVYRLRTALGRELLATPEHPLLTDGRLAAAGESGPGDASRRAWRARMRRAGIGTVCSSWPASVSPTYDLAVEEDHNFIANDLVVHNSRRAASFALLAYASAISRRHHPAAFYATLLNNQPMGFYDPATIVGTPRANGQAYPSRRRQLFGLAVYDRMYGRIYGRVYGRIHGRIHGLDGRRCGWGCATSRVCVRRWASASRRSAGGHVFASVEPIWSKRAGCAATRQIARGRPGSAPSRASSQSVARRSGTPSAGPSRGGLV